MIALTGKPIKGATIEDLRRIEDHIKEYRAKMDNIDDPIAKGYFQMDIDYDSFGQYEDALEDALKWTLENLV